MRNKLDIWESAVWRPALEKYGSATRLTVALYDADGRLTCGPFHGTLLFDLFAQGARDTGLFTECSQLCLRQTRDEERVIVADRFGLAVVATRISLEGIPVGAAVAGYRLCEFPQAIVVERLAREAQVPVTRLWDAVRQETPASKSNLISQGELLHVLADTIVREHDRSRQHVELSARLQAADAAKDEFLAMVSHELRGPLNAILGWTRLLRTETLKENAREHALETIERSAWAQARLVEDLLDVSQIVAGRPAGERQTVESGRIVKDAIASVAPEAQDKRVQLHHDLPTNGVLVMGDPSQLQRIVLNLLGNAVKFSPPGADVCVKLSHDQARATLTVSDSGEGIKPDFLPHIFEPFRQQDASPSRVHGGIGLGLTIVRHLVALHGGSVTAESPGVGRGATFTVALPLAVGGASSGTNSLVARHGDAIDREPLPVFTRRVDILVVDDDPRARELLYAVLQRAGADVTTVESTTEALRVIERNPPAVLLSDIGLPNEDGYSLIRQVRMLPPVQGGRMFAIAVTAYADGVNRQRALSSGYDRHLSKPIDPQVLIHTIESLTTNAPISLRLWNKGAVATTDEPLRIGRRPSDDDPRNS